MEWYLTVLRKYAVFSGRARRMEYWMFNLFNGIIFVVIGLLALFIFGREATIVADVYLLAITIPYIAVLVRRLHDVGRSGWWWLVAFTPVVGQVILLYFTVLNSEPGENKYGENPKE